MAAYRSTVEPMIAARVTVREREAEVRDRLAGWALQGGYLVDSYARVLGRCDAAELAVVAGSFTRLYDDVLDEGWDAGIGERLARLFDGDEVLAHSDIEWLAGDLFRWLASRVPEPHGEMLYERLRELHGLQLERADAASQPTCEEVAQLAVRKGGAAMAILGGLVSPHADARELGVLCRLGGVLQLIDDYDDAFEDEGVCTSANWSRVPFGTLAAELRIASREIVRLHGRRRAAAFVDGLHCWLVLVGLRRLHDRVRAVAAGPVAAPRSGVAMIAARKPHIR